MMSADNTVLARLTDYKSITNHIFKALTTETVVPPIA